MKKLCDFLVITGNVVGAMLVAFSQHHVSLAVAGYSFFLVGSVSSIWLLRHSNASNSLIYVNVFFTIVNVAGIATRVFW